jgi:hypothetical protein
MGSSKFSGQVVSKCEDEDVAIKPSDAITLSVRSGNHKSHLAPDYERYSRPSAPPKSVCDYIKLFCTGIGILDMQLLIQNERCPANRRYELSLNDLSRANPVGQLGAPRSNKE